MYVWLNDAWSRIVGIHFVEEGRINHDPAVDGDLKGAVVLLHEEGIAPALKIVCSHQRNERTG
jgi:hypothetical protein